jgi:predicted Ser/Thr protein kinase
MSSIHDAGSGKLPDMPAQAADHGELLSSGYQGAVYKIVTDSQCLIVKKTMGSGLVRRARRWMIRREYKAYQRLEGLHGVPKCFGLRNNDELVLEFIQGSPLRDLQAELPDADNFLAALKDIILCLHKAGVAHSDLKRKDNILLTSDGAPCLIDFGSAVLLDEHAGILNRYLFRQACRIDLNAWIKLKYRRRIDEISDEDLSYYKPTVAEAVARWLRRGWRILTGRQWRNARRQGRSE